MEEEEEATKEVRAMDMIKATVAIRVTEEVKDMKAVVMDTKEDIAAMGTRVRTTATKATALPHLPNISRATTATAKEEVEMEIGGVVIRTDTAVAVVEVLLATRRADARPRILYDKSCMACSMCACLPVI